MSTPMTTGEHIMHLLPATMDELLPQLIVKNPATAYRWIARLRKAKKIRVAKWRPSIQRYIPVYAVGSRKDAEYPTAPLPGSTGEHIEKLLPATSTELLAQLDINSEGALHSWLTRLREAKRVRIGRWIRTRSSFVPVYARGHAPDAPRPTPYTSAEAQRRYIARLKQTGRYMDYLMHCRKLAFRGRQRRGQKGYRPEAFDPLLVLFYRRVEPQAA
jgi:hypothetical protein